jgi:hypothetical protein
LHRIVPRGIAEAFTAGREGWNGMNRIWHVPLLAGVLLSLSGCIAGMAVGAAGMAVRGATAEGPSNAHLAPAAQQACTAVAGQHGAVHIIDVEQRRADRIIVWGTVGAGEARRSFQCTYGTRITDFKLREIRPQR